MKKIVAFLLMFCLCFTFIAAIDLGGHTLHAEDDDVDLGGDPIDPGDDPGADPGADPGVTPPATQTPLFYVTLDRDNPPSYRTVNGVATLTVTYVVVISDKSAISGGTLILNPITEIRSPSGYVSIRAKLTNAKVVGGNLFGKPVATAQYPSTQVGLAIGAVSSVEANKAFTAYTKNDRSNLSWVKIEYPVTAVNNPLIEVDFCTGSYLTRNGQRYAPNAEDMKYVGNLEVYVCEHLRYDYVTVREPNCKTAGVQEYRCAYCGMKHPKQADKVLLPTSHTLDFSRPFNTGLYEYIAPTCTTPGRGYFRCVICDKYEYTNAPILEHKWEARYLSNGVWKQKCATCGTIRNADNQCNHPAENYELVKINTPSTCSTAGEGVYRCPICGEAAEETRALPKAEHTVAIWVTTKTASCNQAGSKSGTCSVCKNEVTKETPKLEHAFDSWRVTVASTCVKDGERSRTCANCDFTEKEPIEKGGHSLSPWEVITDATCAAEGQKKRVCANCGEAEIESIDKIAHSYGAWTVSQAPTCTEIGTETRACAVCGEDETRTVEIDPNAHKYGDWKSITAKTCTKDGEKERTCEYCDHVDREVDASTGHQFGELVNNKKVTSRTCSVCEYTESVETTKKGTIKTLSCIDGSVRISGELASQNVQFEIKRMDKNDEQYKFYSENVHCVDAYIFSLTLDGQPVALTEDIDFTIALDVELENNDVVLSVLRNNIIYGVENVSRKNLNVTADGSAVNGADAIFVRINTDGHKGSVFPIIIVALTLVLGGGAAYFFIKRGNRGEEI